MLAPIGHALSMGLRDVLGNTVGVDPRLVELGIIVAIPASDGSSLSQRFAGAPVMVTVWVFVFAEVSVRPHGHQLEGALASTASLVIDRISKKWKSRKRS